MPISDNAKARFRAVTSIRTDRAIPIREAAERLSVSERTIRRMIADGQLASCRARASVRVLESSLRSVLGSVTPDRD
jgi:excisionase family DNA binding protein